MTMRDTRCVASESAAQDMGGRTHQFPHSDQRGSEYRAAVFHRGYRPGFGHRGQGALVIPGDLRLRKEHA
jgi:hypothetical protein